MKKELCPITVKHSRHGGRIYARGLVGCVLLLMGAWIAPAQADMCTLVGKKSVYRLLPPGSIRAKSSDAIGKVYATREQIVPITVRCTVPRPIRLKIMATNHISNGLVTQIDNKTVSNVLRLDNKFGGYVRNSGFSVKGELLMDNIPGVCPIFAGEVSFINGTTQGNCAGSNWLTITPPSDTSSSKPYDYTFYPAVRGTLYRSSTNAVTLDSSTMFYMIENMLYLEVFGYDANGIPAGAYSSGSIGGNGYKFDTYTGDMTVSTTGCSVTTPTVNLPLGSFPLSRFSGVGTVAGERQFDINLDCDASVRVNLQLTGITGDYNTLQLTNAGHDGFASGVGLQILYQGSVLVPDGNKTQILPSAISGKNTVTLSARYYQTAATVTEGKAEAAATLLIYYN